MGRGRRILEAKGARGQSEGDNSPYTYLRPGMVL